MKQREHIQDRDRAKRGAREANPIAESKRPRPTGINY